MPTIIRESRFSSEPLVQAAYLNKRPDGLELDLPALERQSDAWVGANAVDLLRLLACFHPMGGFEACCRRLSALLARADLDATAESVKRALVPEGHAANGVVHCLVTAAYRADPVHEPLVERVAFAAGLASTDDRVAMWFPAKALDVHCETRFAAYFRRAVTELEGGAVADPVRAARGVPALLERASASIEDESLLLGRLGSEITVALDTLCELVARAPSTERPALVDRVLIVLGACSLLRRSVTRFFPDRESASQARLRFDPESAENQVLDRFVAWLALSMRAEVPHEVITQCERMATKYGYPFTSWDVNVFKIAALEQAGDFHAAFELVDRYRDDTSVWGLRARLLLKLGRPREAIGTSIPSFSSVADLERLAQQAGVTREEVYDVALAHDRGTQATVVAETRFDIGIAIGRIDAAMGIATRYKLSHHVRTYLSRTLAPYAMFAVRRWLVDDAISIYPRELNRRELQRTDEAYIDAIRREYESAVALAPQLENSDALATWQQTLVKTAPFRIVRALGLLPKPEATPAPPPPAPRPSDRKRRIIE